MKNILKRFCFSLLVMVLMGQLFPISGIQAQQKIYEISWKKEGILTCIGMGAGVTSLFLQSKIKTLSQADIQALDPSKLWALDRKAIGINSNSASKASDIISIGTLVLPFSLLFSKDIHKEDKKALVVMAVETVLITEAMTRLLKVTVQRNRPYVYDPSIEYELKNTIDSQSSFPSGHTSKAAAFSFYTASALDDLYPESKLRTLYWTGAFAIPALTGYLRVRSSNHFPTDVIVGYVLGASIGYLIPRFHKSNKTKLTMTSDGGLSLTFKLN